MQKSSDQSGRCFFIYKISSISACVIGLICASVFLAFLSLAIIFPSSKATTNLPNDTRWDKTPISTSSASKNISPYAPVIGRSASIPFLVSLHDNASLLFYNRKYYLNLRFPHSFRNLLFAYVRPKGRSIASKCFFFY